MRADPTTNLVAALFKPALISVCVAVASICGGHQSRFHTTRLFASVANGVVNVCLIVDSDGLTRVTLKKVSSCYIKMLNSAYDDEDRIPLEAQPCISITPGESLAVHSPHTAFTIKTPLLPYRPKYSRALVFWVEQRNAKGPISGGRYIMTLF